MTWNAVMSLSALQQKQRDTVMVNGHKVLLIWHNETVHAVQAQCPHLKLPLIKGTITEECTLVCPFHKSAFDLKTGAVKCWSPWPPAVGPLLGKVSKPKSMHIYQTRIEDDQILIKSS